MVALVVIAKRRVITTTRYMTQSDRLIKVGQLKILRDILGHKSFLRNSQIECHRGYSRVSQAEVAQTSV